VKQPASYKVETVQVPYAAPMLQQAHWRHMSSLLVNIYPEDEGR